MIEFSNNIKTLLQNPVIDAFYMVRINTYLTTSHVTNITVDGNTYLSDGRLLSVDPPKLSSSVDRELYKVTLADPDYSIGGTMQTGIVGKTFEVRLGFVDPITSQPYTALSDTVLIYKGFVDSIAYNIETNQQGEVALLVTGASPMANLDVTKTFYTSRDFIRSISPTDSCFDQVYEGSGTVNLKWGKT
jgi:hypothetical protein